VSCDVAIAADAHHADGGGGCDQVEVNDDQVLKRVVVPLTDTVASVEQKVMGRTIVKYLEYHIGVVDDSR